MKVEEPKAGGPQIEQVEAQMEPQIEQAEAQMEPQIVKVEAQMAEEPQIEQTVGRQDRWGGGGGRRSERVLGGLGVRSVRSVRSLCEVWGLHHWGVWGPEDAF